MSEQFPLLIERVKMLKEADAGGADLAPIDFEMIAIVERVGALEQVQEAAAAANEDITAILHNWNDKRMDIALRLLVIKDLYLEPALAATVQDET